MGSRVIYHDGWMASRVRPAHPVDAGLPPGIQDWTPDKDAWELYNLEEDWTQANDLAAKMPDKLAQMKELFIDRGREEQGTAHRRRPLDSRLPPGAAHGASLHEWTFSGDIVRMPEFCAPALGNKPNVVTIDAEIPANANGVLYKLGG